MTFLFGDDVNWYSRTCSKQCRNTGIANSYLRRTVATRATCCRTLKQTEPGMMLVQVCVTLAVLHEPRLSHRIIWSLFSHHFLNGRCDSHLPRQQRGYFEFDCQYRAQDWQHVIILLFPLSLSITLDQVELQMGCVNE